MQSRRYRRVIMVLLAIASSNTVAAAWHPVLSALISNDLTVISPEAQNESTLVAHWQIQRIGFTLTIESENFLFDSANEQSPKLAPPELFPYNGAPRIAFSDGRASVQWTLASQQILVLRVEPVSDLDELAGALRELSSRVHCLAPVSLELPRALTQNAELVLTLPAFPEPLSDGGWLIRDKYGRAESLVRSYGVSVAGKDARQSVLRFESIVSSTGLLPTQGTNASIAGSRRDVRWYESEDRRRVAISVSIMLDEAMIFLIAESRSRAVLADLLLALQQSRAPASADLSDSLSSEESKVVNPRNLREGRYRIVGSRILIVLEHENRPALATTRDALLKIWGKNDEGEQLILIPLRSGSAELPNDAIPISRAVVILPGAQSISLTRISKVP